MIAVYLDAIFAPNLLRQEEIFLQEGVCRSVTNNKLTYNGVVLNEMKAVFSDVEQIAFSKGRALALNNTYLSYESGGIPEEI